MAKYELTHLRVDENKDIFEFGESGDTSATYSIRKEEGTDADTYHLTEDNLDKGEPIVVPKGGGVAPLDWIKVYSGSPIINFNTGNSILVGMLQNGDEGWVLDSFANNEIRVVAQGPASGFYVGDVYTATYNMQDIYDVIKSDVLQAMPEQLSPRIYPFHFVSMIEANRNDNVHVEFKFIIAWHDNDMIELRIVPVVNKAFLPGGSAPISGTSRVPMEKLTIFVR